MVAAKKKPFHHTLTLAFRRAEAGCEVAGKKERARAACSKIIEKGPLLAASDFCA